MKDETDSQVPQFKKKAKELRILDAKTAQNLCKYILFLRTFHNLFNTIGL